MSESSTDIARAHVQRVIEAARAQGTRRLPPIRHMARDAGVAHAYIGRAVKVLVKQGVLRAAPSRGITLAGDGASSERAPHHRSLRWTRLYQRVCGDCLDGVIGYDQPLPAVKDLCQRYGGAPVTMRKVVRQLEANGIVAASGRGMRVTRASPADNRNTVLMYARAMQTGEVASFTHRIEQQLYGLEQVCIARGVNLVIQPCRFDQGGEMRVGESRDSRVALGDNQRALGHIVWQEGNGLPSGFVRSLVAHLAALNQPVALFSENGEPLVAPFKSKARQLRCFVCDSDFAAGRRVGHFLLVRGHRRVCCFAVFAGGKWERNRIAGLRSVYAESGLHDAVTVCYALSAQQDRDITRRRHASNLRIEQALAGVARRSGVAWRPTPLSDFAATHVAERLDRERIFAALEPSMRRLAKDRGTTAWVGTNDDMAADCLQFLRDQDVGVPEQVSVVGFDDSYLAASCCMTSYGFNGAAAMVRMVDYILRPNTVLDRGAASGTVLVEGAVHERSTTAGVGR